MDLPLPVVEKHCGINVVRDDLLEGGTKMRAIMPIISSSAFDEFVYASPAQGYAQVALALCAKALGKRATIFTAKRKVMHPLTKRAYDAGAKIVMVPHGYLSNVTKKASDYSNKVCASYVPFGASVEGAMEGIAAAARSIPAPQEVWTVAGSGVLTRSLQRAWPHAKFNAVVVGSESIDVGIAKKYIHPLKFEQDTKILPPFPSAKNYDAKAWEFILKHATEGALFWNVGK